MGKSLRVFRDILKAVGLPQNYHVCTGANQTRAIERGLVAFPVGRVVVPVAAARWVALLFYSNEEKAE